MAILTYAYESILVDISDTVEAGTIVKRRARRFNVTLPDNGREPCVLEVEIIPYANDKGGYGKELTGGVFTRTTRKLRVSADRLVDEVTGRILASRYGEGGALRPDADWQADVARLAADESVRCLPQAEWFNKIMNEVPAVVNTFIIQYIQLADFSGDLN